MYNNPHSHVAQSCDTQTVPDNCPVFCRVMLSVSIIRVTDDNGSHSSYYAEKNADYKLHTGDLMIFLSI
jgi:hypothetical protein